VYSHLCIDQQCWQRSNQHSLQGRSPKAPYNLRQRALRLQSCQRRPAVYFMPPSVLRCRVSHCPTTPANSHNAPTYLFSAYEKVHLIQVLNRSLYFTGGSSHHLRWHEPPYNECIYIQVVNTRQRRDEHTVKHVVSMIYSKVSQKSS
jgi:hypothetical protein